MQINLDYPVSPSRFALYSNLQYVSNNISPKNASGQSKIMNAGGIGENKVWFEKDIHGWDGRVAKHASDFSVFTDKI